MVTEVERLERASEERYRPNGVFLLIVSQLNPLERGKVEGENPR